MKRKVYTLSFSDDILDFERIGVEFMELTKKQKEILIHIAKKGLKTKYDLSMKDRVAADSTVFHALERLAENNLVKVRKTEAFPKIEGRVKKYYGLTFRGIIASLKTTRVKINEIKDLEKLVSLWIDSCAKIGKEFRIDRKIGLPINWGKTQKIKAAIIKYINKNPEDITRFMQHFDLQFSSEEEIFKELLLHVTTSRESKGIINVKVRKAILKERKRLV